MLYFGRRPEDNIFSLWRFVNMSYCRKSIKEIIGKLVCYKSTKDKNEENDLFK